MDAWPKVLDRGESTDVVYLDFLLALDVMDAWTKVLDRGESIDVVYLDFLLALDAVPHKILIGKLKSYA